MEDAVAMSSATSSPPARGTAYAIDILIRGFVPARQPEARPMTHSLSPTLVRALRPAGPGLVRGRRSEARVRPSRWTVARVPRAVPPIAGRGTLGRLHGGAAPRCCRMRTRRSRPRAARVVGAGGVGSLRCPIVITHASLSARVRVERIRSIWERWRPSVVRKILHLGERRPYGAGGGVPVCGPGRGFLDIP